MSKIKYGPHACFSDLTTQRISNTSVAQAVTFNTDEEKYRITHSTSVNPSKITIEVAGTYMIFFSAVVDVTGGTNQKINMWLAVDGSNVDRSNTVLTIPGSTESTLAVAFMYRFTAGQYFEIMMSGTTTGVGIVYTGAQITPTRPACPSIILTVHKVSTSD